LTIRVMHRESMRGGRNETSRKGNSGKSERTR